MADWSKIASRGNVQDRRGLGNTVKFGGGAGIIGLVLYLAFSFLNGGDVSDVLPQLLETQVVPQSMNASVFEGADQYEVFTSTVLGSANSMWSQVFAQNNLTYNEPQLVLFRGGTESSCGGATSESGPHYCPLDNTIYLDETFFDELQRRFGGSSGDVAQAYVIAHEVGHHAQYELGTINLENAQMSNADSIRAELQADCYAGLWAYSIKDRGVFEPGEIKEALDAASAVGDDRIQATVTGRVNPESWTHGSSAERVAWFNRGFEQGTLAACNTFE